MKFACLSDWHITYDNPVARRENFIETEKTKLEFIFSYCKENNLTLLSSGDIFDGPRSWRAFDLLSDILRRYSSVEVFRFTEYFNWCYYKMGRY
jgi:DNA repair exonuclease SbcCD nuclease subunit